MQIDFRQILNGLRKRWWLALLVMVSAAAVAYLYENSKEDIYQTQVTLAAKCVPLDNGCTEAVKKTMATYGQELSSRELWRFVVDDRQIHDVDLSTLDIVVQPRQNPDVLVMTVDHRDPTIAARLAEGIAEEFVNRKAAETEGVTVGGYKVVWTIPQPAYVPARPYQPRPGLYAGAAALFGLILGLLLAIGLELLDTTLKTPADVKQWTELNTVGIIPRGSR